MAHSSFGFISLYVSFLRRRFTVAHLSQQAINVDGETTIHFWGPNPQQSTQKPSLVLIHGFGPLSLMQWRQQVSFFAPHFNLYVPDLIFFGDSTTKSSERSEIFQAKSVAKALETLGVEKYSVMGTSYGGFVAYHMARLWPERVEKVVIASSGVNMRKRDNEELAKRAKLENVSELLLPQNATDLRALLGLAIFKSVPPIVPDFFLNSVVKHFYSENRKERMELLKGLTLGRDDTVNLSPLEQDVLLVWGEHDQIFPLEMTHELKGLIGKNVKLETIEKASHAPQVERPGRFNNIVRNFLSGSS